MSHDAVSLVSAIASVAAVLGIAAAWFAWSNRISFLWGELKGEFKELRDTVLERLGIHRAELNILHEKVGKSAEEIAALKQAQKDRE